DWGTANRIVPLGDAYLELIAVVDEQEAEGSAFGQWVTRASASGAQPFAWAVRTDALDATAARLELAISAGSRTTPSGELLGWRLAGLERAEAEPSLPFFLEWAEGTPFPGRAGREQEIVRLELTANPERIAGWLGEHDLPVRIARGTPAVRSVVLKN